MHISRITRRKIVGDIIPDWVDGITSTTELVKCPSCGSRDLKKLLSAHAAVSGSSASRMPGPGDTACCGASPGQADCAGPGSCCGKA